MYAGNSQHLNISTIRNSLFRQLCLTSWDNIWGNVWQGFYVVKNKVFCIKRFWKLENMHLHITVLFGNVSRKIYKKKTLIQKQTPAYSFAKHYWNFKRVSFHFMVRWNQKNKKSFLTANTQDGFGAHRDKKHPLCTMKYTAVYLMLRAYFFKLLSWQIEVCKKYWKKGKQYFNEISLKFVFSNKG